jgi:hypothetical protein
LCCAAVLCCLATLAAVFPSLSSPVSLTQLLQFSAFSFRFPTAAPTRIFQKHKRQEFLY